MTSYLAVALGSACGGAARYWITIIVERSNRTQLPLGTLIVNLTGALLAGALIASLAAAGSSTRSLGVMLAIVGFCGSYTTVSSFSLQTLQLWQRGSYRWAVLNVAGSLFGTLAGAALGMVAVSLWVGPV